MKAVLLCLVMLAVSGCDMEARRPQKTGKIGGISIVRIEGCEYLENQFVTSGGFIGTVYTHKGNCDNPIHKK